MFNQNQLETLHSLVNKEINIMYENEVAYNRDIILNYIKHLTALRAEIEKQQTYTTTTVSNLGDA